METTCRELGKYDWGPEYLVPSKALPAYSGSVMLRCTFDRELLDKHLKTRGFSGSIARVTGSWFFRKKYSEIWTKIGESCDIRRDFAVRWDTSRLENGQYEIIGFMQAFFKNDSLKKWQRIDLGNGEYAESGYKPFFVEKHLEKRVIAEQKIMEVAIEN